MPNNSFNRSADTQVVINTNRLVRPVNSSVRSLALFDLEEVKIMEETIYLIPTNPEFYGAKTEEEAARCAGVLMQELSVHVIEQAYPVEFRMVDVSPGYRGYGDAGIISELESLELEHLAEWLNGVIQ